MTILVVRHAVAVRRKHWPQADQQRPLTARGRGQAAGLVALLAEFAVERVLSSPALRCLDTVRPLAAAMCLSVGEAGELAEGSGTAATVLADANGPRAVVLCSHGDVIPALVKALAAGRGPAELPCAKGSTWVIEDEGGESPRLRYLPPAT